MSLKVMLRATALPTERQIDREKSCSRLGVTKGQRRFRSDVFSGSGGKIRSPQRCTQHFTFSLDDNNMLPPETCKDSLLNKCIFTIF